MSHSIIDPRYGVAASPRVVEPGQPVPKGGGAYRVGQPYVVGSMSGTKENHLQPRYSPSARAGIIAITGAMAGPLVRNLPPAREAKIDRAETSVRGMMLAAIPALRAFAISLCGNANRADDLVQETVVRALTHIDSFRPGSMIAWLITILRNVFHTEWRKRRWERPDRDGSYAAKLQSQPGQSGGLEFKELHAALTRLPM